MPGPLPPGTWKTPASSSQLPASPCSSGLQWPLWRVCLTGFSERLVSNFKHTQGLLPSPCPSPCFCAILCFLPLCPPHQHPCRWQQPILESLPRRPLFPALSSPGSLFRLQRKPTAAQQARHTRLPRGLCSSLAWRVPADVWQGSPFFIR